MKKQNYEYTGTGNLEAMVHAVNYNRFLVDAVVCALKAGNEPILDFGAGVGTFAMDLRLRGIDPICVEPDEAQRRVLIKRGLRATPSLDSLPDDSIGGAYTLNVLEHINDDVGALRDLRMKMRKGSRLFIYVPAFQILYSSMDELVGHVRRYRVAELRAKVESAGFVVQDSRYADCIGFGAALLYRLSDRSGGNINESALKAYDRVAFPLSRAFDRIGVSRLFGKNVMLRAIVP